MYVTESYDPSRWLVVPTGVWMSEHIGPYRRWFQENCMYTVFLGAQYLQGIENPIPPPIDEVGEIGYIPSGPCCEHNIYRVFSATCCEHNL